MSKTRIVVIAATSVLLLAGGAVYLLFSNLNLLVERGIESFGSKAAGTAVRVARVEIDLRQGRGSIYGLTVANPADFSREAIFALGEITLALNVASLTSPVPVVEELRIGAPTFLYEVNNRGGSNLAVLKKNLQQTAGKDRPQKAAADEAPRRLRIKALSVAKGKGSVDLRAVGGKRYEAGLERITLKNLGGRQGLTADELANVLLAALVKELEQVALRQGTKELLRSATGDAAADALRKLQNR